MAPCGGNVGPTGLPRQAARDLGTFEPLVVLLVVTVVGLTGDPIKATVIGEIRGPRCCWPRRFAKRTSAPDLGSLRCLRGWQGATTEPLVSCLAVGRATPVPVAAGAGRRDLIRAAGPHPSVVNRRSR